MAGHIIMIVLGLAFVAGGLRESAERLRLQRRARRARAVFVAREEAGHMAGPGVRSRTARFRFTAEGGRVVERASALTTFPGPRPGRTLTVVYDPDRPESTAERAWVHLAMLVAGPVAVVAGAVIVAAGAAGL
ncbi:DUF3592 domain-containing protein [Spirillospora sp. NPDC029432]|uniref:DUF3592 domain-containing protein n=1 Tax=Spirillospora sp. NPDC029432 TaxID=3154599 RepID=UPI003451CB49